MLERKITIYETYHMWRVITPYDQKDYATPERALVYVLQMDKEDMEATGKNVVSVIIWRTQTEKGFNRVRKLKDQNGQSDG